ncbi:uncharacterized protein A4U43_C09F10550 [Asparagus officinalis]|uniref:Lysine ketoglutarate reductase trans-splicing related 1 n=1 Tax=Asparagus officinalis TaxID=4686 RepID=A0A5P1E6U2_ASPOF|nr:uncharacterized protein LOC109824040 isoform X2 [Asparagus officinalis]ONK58280.1 uncharacterized protein A4U43_C09F10550 [Asparagus officinalis]
MKISLSSCGPNLRDLAQRRACSCRFLSIAVFICFTSFVGSPYVLDYKHRLSSAWAATDSMQKDQSSLCECKPLGSENLPKGIICKNSNLEFLPVSLRSWKRKGSEKEARSLLAIAVGIKQKEVVDLIVQKFLLSNFTVMLFHYDGVVDEWSDLKWSGSALHVSAINQTKWWFAKRFLHPDIVAEYDYVFLWDEDLGVENFHPQRYISIIKREKLEISQPALDTAKSLVHHQITARGRKGDVHRRIYKYRGGGRCYENSTAPPCTGWVEMMAPVFSRAAWRCVWYMIQNDLIHAWGLDKKLGYCVQGDRTQHVGVVDGEYIVHLGIPTLGSVIDHKVSLETSSNDSQLQTPNSGKAMPPVSSIFSGRSAVRMRSFTESEIFKRRWKRAVAEDKCWRDPYPEPKNKTGT